ncbi:MAG: hypothetical protein IJ850_06885 [Alistipes sp.]|uniref:hypothetical protein n=1 Tax=Alistipes TaxID=239759 RepID=UPI001A917F31|nr:MULTISPECIES: hypothetical protein [Alistipes]MBR2218054.1 hypothetical protein [Alistipes sp.]
MIFNIYYINFPKVYEIKMMLSNIISKAKEVTQGTDCESQEEIKAKFGIKFFDFFNTGVEGASKTKGSDSKKVLETFEVKTTKSIILSEVVEKSNKINSFDKIKEGELIMLNNVELSLENEAELRVIKFFTSGAFKDMAVPGANGFDMTNLFNSMFKDYAYKIKGAINDNSEEILIKIPITFENEFESSYSVDDLFVGKVAILGLYKGKIKIEELRNSFQFFAEIGNMQNLNQHIPQSEDDEIQESQYPQDNKSSDYNFFVSSGDGKDYHYIDLLAIVQTVNIVND